MAHNFVPMDEINEFIDTEIFRIGTYALTLETVLAAIIILIVTRVLLWLVRKIMFRPARLDESKMGNLHALFQIIKYIIWVAAILLILDTLGLKLNVLLAGSAALLVGVGLGLQNTFNNFISGIILLFEGSIKVGDVLEIDGDVIKILNIGLRTSDAINRDDIRIIIPNSVITANKVINWSHQSQKTRFRIKVGVAYGSDVELVEKLLKESALEHPEIESEPKVMARFLDFGNSSLDFELLFFSKNIFRIENVKSDIRKNINRKFIENDVTIPFPQLDLHVKSKIE